MTPCVDCNNNTPLVFNVQSFLNSVCTSCGDTACLPSSNVCYTGPKLLCSGILTNDSLEDALTKIDTILCSSTGNYSTYQMHCLPAWKGTAITTEAAFVDAITDYACTTKANLTTFIGTTFSDYQTVVDGRFLGITSPGIVCASAAITNTDNLQSIYSKYCAKFTSIDATLNISSLNFASCFTVTIPPLTIIQGFQEIINQICSLKATVTAGGITLPMFNNVGTCLATPGTTDTLVDTITKIRSRVCLSPTYLSTNLTWGCVGAPTSTTSIEEGLQRVITKTNYILPKIPTFGAGFTVTPTDIADPCAGVNVAISAGSTDRLVASNNTDTTPGTLFDKLLGDGNVIDGITTPGKVIIKSDHKLLASSVDTTADYLVNKLHGSSASGITVTPTYNALTKKVDLILSVDNSILCAIFSNCAGTIPCVSYRVTPATTSSLSYVDCTGNVINIASIGGITNICARFGTVYAPAATIVNMGACVPACSAPTGLVASGITPTSFTETWDAVPSAASYEYRIDGGAYTNIGSSLTTTVSALLPSSTHIFEVRAIIGITPCASVASNSITTNSNFALSAAYNMNITSVTGTGIPALGATGPNGSLQGTHTAISGTTSVTVTGTPLSTAKIDAYVNGIIVSCVPMPTAGTYSLTFTALSTDVVSIAIDGGVCAAP